MGGWAVAGWWLVGEGQNPRAGTHAMRVQEFARGGEKIEVGAWRQNVIDFRLTGAVSLTFSCSRAAPHFQGCRRCGGRGGIRARAPLGVLAKRLQGFLGAGRGEGGEERGGNGWEGAVRSGAFLPPPQANR